MVVIADEHSTRYLHRLCGRCVRAVTYRRREIVECSPKATVTMELLPLKLLPLMLFLPDPEGTGTVNPEEPNPEPHPPKTHPPRTHRPGGTDVGTNEIG